MSNGDIIRTMMALELRPETRFETLLYFITWLLQGARQPTEAELHFLSNNQRGALPPKPPFPLKKPTFEKQEAIRALLAHHPGGSADEYHDLRAQLPAPSLTAQQIQEKLTPLHFTGPNSACLTRFKALWDAASPEPEPLDQTLFSDFDSSGEAAPPMGSVRWHRDGRIALRRDGRGRAVVFGEPSLLAFDGRYMDFVAQMLSPIQLYDVWDGTAWVLDARNTQLGFYEQEYECGAGGLAGRLLEHYAMAVYPPFRLCERPSMYACNRPLGLVEDVEKEVVTVENLVGLSYRTLARIHNDGIRPGILTRGEVKSRQVRVQTVGALGNRRRETPSRKVWLLFGLAMARLQAQARKK